MVQKSQRIAVLDGPKKHPEEIMWFQLPTSPSPGELVYRMEPSTVYGSIVCGG